MVALSYPCRACPLAMLEHHVLVSRLKEEDKVMTKAISKSSYILREEDEVQVQEKHLEEILCLKLVTHLEILVK
jgi:hypothetical protein